VSAAVMNIMIVNKCVTIPKVVTIAHATLAIKSHLVTQVNVKILMNAVEIFLVVLRTAQILLVVIIVHVWMGTFWILMVQHALILMSAVYQMGVVSMIVQITMDHIYVHVNWDMISKAILVLLEAAPLYFLLSMDS
jgi:hypothetical protein